jgi:hypothetical protein
MDVIGVGLCRTDADEPAVMGSSAGVGDANKERHQGARKNARISPPALLGHIEYVGRKSGGRAGSSSGSRKLHYSESSRLDSDQGKAAGRRYPDNRGAGDKG